MATGISQHCLKIRPVRKREHFLFNLLNFLYFRKTEAGVRFLLENGPLSIFVVVPYVPFSEIYFFRQWRYFAVLEQRIAGILALQNNVKALYISSLAVSPSYRRIGIATYLLSYASTIAEKSCKNTLELAVLKRNTPALKLYAKQGFRIERETRRTFTLRKQIKEA